MRYKANSTSPLRQAPIYSVLPCPSESANYLDNDLARTLRKPGESGGRHAMLAPESAARSYLSESWNGRGDRNFHLRAWGVRDSETTIAAWAREKLRKLLH